jgi:hypothetical protein
MADLCLAKKAGVLGARGNPIMSWHTLFWMLCAVIVADVVVAAIAIMKAYREEAAHRGYTYRPHKWAAQQTTDPSRIAISAVGLSSKSTTTASRSLVVLTATVGVGTAASATDYSWNCRKRISTR